MQSILMLTCRLQDNQSKNLLNQVKQILEYKVLDLIFYIFLGQLLKFLSLVTRLALVFNFKHFRNLFKTFFLTP